MDADIATTLYGYDEVLQNMTEKIFDLILAEDTDLESLQELHDQLVREEAGNMFYAFTTMLDVQLDVDFKSTKSCIQLDSESGTGRLVLGNQPYYMFDGLGHVQEVQLDAGKDILDHEEKQDTVYALPPLRSMFLDKMLDERRRNDLILYTQRFQYQHLLGSSEASRLVKALRGNNLASIDYELLQKVFQMASKCQRPQDNTSIIWKLQQAQLPSYPAICVGQAYTQLIRDIDQDSAQQRVNENMESFNFDDSDEADEPPRQTTSSIPQMYPQAHMGFCLMSNGKEKSTGPFIDLNRFSCGHVGIENRCPIHPNVGMTQIIKSQLQKAYDYKE